MVIFRGQTSSGDFWKLVFFQSLQKFHEVTGDGRLWIAAFDSEPKLFRMADGDFLISGHNFFDEGSKSGQVWRRFRLCAN